LVLIPLFVAGLAIQQLLEILDPLAVRIIGEKDKRMILGIISFLAGISISIGTGLRVLQPLGVHNMDLFDAIVTALIISAGTESFNSIIKFLGYAKEGKKSDAAALKAYVSRDPSAKFVLQSMDRKKK
jgi:hypothetical protein